MTAEQRLERLRRLRKRALIELRPVGEPVPCSTGVAALVVDLVDELLGTIGDLVRLEARS